MGLGAGKLEEVRSDTANVGRVRLNKAMLAMMRSLDNFFFLNRCSGKPLEGSKQGSDEISKMIASKVSASIATIKSGTEATPSSHKNKRTDSVTLTFSFLSKLCFFSY